MPPPRTQAYIDTGETDLGLLCHAVSHQYRVTLASLVPPAPPRRERPCVVVDLARCASALARPTGAPRSVTSQNPTSTVKHTLHT